MTCALCERQKTGVGIPGGPLFADHLLFVAHFPFLKDEPAHYGHFIIETRRHITRPSEMIREEAQALGHWTQVISHLLESKLKAEHVYIVRIGDKTPHLHFHFVPRFPGTPKEVWGPQLWLWPGGRKASEQDMITVTQLLKSGL